MPMNMHKNKVLDEIFKKSKDSNLYSITPDPELWHEDFWDILEVFAFGAKKHGDKNWEDGNKGKKSSFKEMHDSMFHHLAKSFSGAICAFNPQGLAKDIPNSSRLDKETYLDHLLHLAARALMCYSLIKRGKYNES